MKIRRYFSSSKWKLKLENHLSGKELHGFKNPLIRSAFPDVFFHQLFWDVKEPFGFKEDFYDAIEGKVSRPPNFSVNILPASDLLLKPFANDQSVALVLKRLYARQIFVKPVRHQVLGTNAAGIARFELSQGGLDVHFARAAD